MFIDKTEKEYVNLMYNFDFFRELMNVDEFVLNGKTLKSFDSIWGKIKNLLKQN